jgi:hypothetical protein
MLSNTQIEKIALFYFFTYLDEVKSQNATEYTIKKLNSLITIEKSSEADIYLQFVKISHTYVEKTREAQGANHLSVISSHVELPQGSNWGPWFEYRRISQPKEFLILLYHHILKIPIEAIASGLQIAEGTIHYRIAHGLKQLGGICHSGGLNA